MLPGRGQTAADGWSRHIGMYEMSSRFLMLSLTSDSFSRSDGEAVCRGRRAAGRCKSSGFFAVRLSRGGAKSQLVAPASRLSLLTL